MTSVLTLFVGALILTAPLRAQFASARHEPDISWHTLKTEHFFIHTPADSRELGLKVAAICEDIYEPVCRSLNYYPGPTHVVLYTRTDFPGGAASYSPWRIQLSVTEPQGNTFGSGDAWLRILIVHEFTHIVNLRKHKGLSTLAYPLLGDFRAAVHQITPRWFTEGMATVNETRYTSGGRGRNPFHWMQMAAPIWEGKPWKVQNTSFHSRKRAPATYMAYVSGYYLSSFVQERYGPEVWTRILEKYATFPILGFGHAVKSVTGKSLKVLYNEMVGEFARSSTGRQPFSPPVHVWHQPEIPEDQLSPRWIDRDHLVIYRRSLDDLEEVAQIDRTGKKRHIVHRLLAKHDNSFSVGENVIVWAELSPHPRFTATVHSDLKVQDRKTSQVRTLTKNGRIYSPDVSPDETQVVAVQTALPTTRLVTVDLTGGNVHDLLEISGATILNPRWSPDGIQVAFAVKDSSNWQNIAIMAASSGRWRYLYPPNHHHDNNPCWTRDGSTVLYASDQSGVFNIWAVDVSTGRRWMVTDTRLGAFTPDVSITGNELAFATYTHTGFSVATMELDSSQWREEADVARSTNPYVFEKRDTSGAGMGSQPPPVHEIQAYRPWWQILRPQGWFPYIISSENFQAISLFMTAGDVLHRHSWTSNFGFPFSNGAPLAHFSYRYSGWWPELQIRGFLSPRWAYGTRPGWQPHKGVELTGSLPLTLERNVYNTFFEPVFTVRGISVVESGDRAGSGTRNYRGIRLGFNWIRSGQALRDIAPHRAFRISMQVERSVPALGSQIGGRQFSHMFQLFLPTPIPHHQIEIVEKYQARRGDFGYDFYGALPLGYQDDLKNHQLLLRLAYVFPLAYLEFPVPYLPVYLDYVDVKAFIDWGNSWQKPMEIQQLVKKGISSKGVTVSAVTYLFQRIWFRPGIAVFYHSKSRRFKAMPIIQYSL